MTRASVLGKYYEIEAGWFEGASAFYSRNKKNQLRWVGFSGGFGYTFGASVGKGWTIPWFN